MADQQYTPGLLDRLRGRNPNNPTAPAKPSAMQAYRDTKRKYEESKGSKSGDGNIYKNGAGLDQSARRMGKPTSADSKVLERRRQATASAPGDLDGTPSPTKYKVSAAPKPVVRVNSPPPTVASAPKRPIERAAEGMKALRGDDMPAPRQAKPAKPATSKQSWWDKFATAHKLSADKSYSDYKRLMKDM